MADSIAPVTIGPGWTDLYAASGIAVGTPLLLSTGSDVLAAVSATKPTGEVGTKIPYDQECKLDGGQVGLWASSSGGPAKIYLQADTGGAIRLTPFFDSRVVDGFKSITTQPYTELHIKDGSQFYIGAAWPTGDIIASGATKKIHFVVGDKTILVNRRTFDYIGAELRINLYANPVGVTGGTTVQVYNWNAKNPLATVVSVKKNVSTTSDGTLIAEPEYFFGSVSQGSRVASSIPEGFERVLPGNSEFLVTITNLDNGSARAQYGLTWNEGPISTEFP